MRDHIRILGILNIVLGSFSALAGVVVFIITTTAAGAIAAALRSENNSDYPNGMIAAPAVAAVGLGIALFLILISLPSIIGGWGLMKLRPWSRVLVLILSAFHLFSVPFGTALGIYGFWVLLNRESEQLLATGGASYPPLNPMYPHAQVPPPPPGYPPPGVPPQGR